MSDKDWIAVLAAIVSLLFAIGLVAVAAGSAIVQVLELGQ